MAKGVWARYLDSKPSNSPLATVYFRRRFGSSAMVLKMRKPETHVSQSFGYLDLNWLSKKSKWTSLDRSLFMIEISYVLIVVLFHLYCQV
jgi:hypothetical protein